MTINCLFLTRNQFSRGGSRLKSVKGIVIHYVGNTGQDARAVRHYFESLKDQRGELVDGRVSYTQCRYASAHFIVGTEGQIIQCLPDSEIAYHVGAISYTPTARERLSNYPNDCTIGIELCHRDPSGKFTEATLDAAAGLTAYLCKTYDLDPDRDIWRHYDITGKNCPAWFVTDPQQWEAFKNSVRLNKLFKGITNEP